MHSRLGWRAALVAVLGLGGGAWDRDSSATAPGQAPVFSYWHNWTDDHGVSHMTLCPVRSFDLKSMSPPADPQWQAHQPPGQSQVIFTVQPNGWKGSWHEDPKVQWIIPLSGTWFVEAMDGTRVELGPGQVSLGEDLNTRPDAQGRKGHLSGNVTPGPVTLMVVQLAEEPTVNQPCRFK
ncbi:cupin domain-containing protein [Corallococcus exiguus]|uniref:cupin domain-containing protein n=1 Tax=Corallococcus TaxID=83461 RepID=UPI000EE748C4|nr:MULTISPECIES: cupin domain-containing protein [Corallococcus]NRD62135.1 cupin domain-containing protein [Corallococcus exiguus]RKI19992.1 cupin domain-containing protein [Corallococcus sp. AB030]